MKVVMCKGVLDDLKRLSSFRQRVKDFIYDIKMAFQRMTRGYSDSDVWNLNFRFIEIMPKILRQFIDGHCGFPGTDDVPTDEKWVEILEEMCYYFTEANEETCSQKNEWEDTYNLSLEFGEESDAGVEVHVVSDNEENYKKWSKRDAELAKYRLEMQDKALKMFVKYFNNLWD